MTKNNSQSQSIQKNRHIPPNMLVAAQGWSGPLPSPEDLARYQSISPEVLQTILDMAKKEQESRISRQKEEQMIVQKTIEGNLEIAKKGQNRAFALTLVLGGGGLGLLAAGIESGGIIGVIGAAIVVASPYIKDALVKRKDRQLQIDNLKDS